MNTYLLNLIGKFTGIVVVSTVSLFSINNINQKNSIVEENIINDAYVEHVIEEKEIIFNEVPSEEVIEQPKVEKPIIENKEESVTEVIPEEKVYNGMLTGYGPDCYGCSGLGNLYCPTKNNTVHSLITDSIYYEDEEYGTVRILSADQREFPCGTIIEISNSMFAKEIGIVLDTGSGMRNAYNNGWILIDLAFEKEALAHTITNRETKFVVKRVGW